jgi:hypothetical protein
MRAIAKNGGAGRLGKDYNFRERIVKDADRDAEIEAIKIEVARQDERMHNVASKDDLADLRLHTDRSVLELRNHVDASIADLSNHVDRSIADLRNHVDRSIADLRNHVDRSIADLHNHVDRSIADLRSHMDLQIQRLETRMARWFLAHLVVEVTILVAILGLVWERLPGAWA